MELGIYCNPKSSPYLPSFTANAREYVRAVRHLKRVGLNLKKDTFIQQEQAAKISLLSKKPTEKTNLEENKSPRILDLFKIKGLNIDKLEGIQYGIDVFENLRIRDILLLYRTTDMPARRGCPNMCIHCFQDAKPAAKTELSTMPFEDFKKIIDGFAKFNARINRFIGDIGNTQSDKGADELTYIGPDEIAFFYDSDGMNVVIKDKNGKEYDYTDLTEMFYKKIGGREVLFDTAGWNPKNKILQARAEKYFEYFSNPDNAKKIQYNLSVNTFNPLYAKAYELGYRAGTANDLTNPDIQRGKKLYDIYIERMANMIATLAPSDNANILLTYSSRFEKNMHGMYLSDLKLILKDVEKRCNEILKERYPDEYWQKSYRISRLISSSISHAEGYNVQPRCAYAGRYKETYYSRNKHMLEASAITPEVPDINALSPDEFKDFFKKHVVIIDVNGKIYYQQYDTSVRSLGKELKLSTNGKRTPKIANLEHRT